MKKALLPIALLIAAYALYEQRVPPFSAPSATGVAHESQLRVEPPATAPVLVAAFRERRSNLQVQAGGQVVRVLPDDREGSRHQRFLVRVAPGQTVLIAHNIDLAPRIAALQPGEPIEFSGEYEWNERGGVVHWTHHDPQGTHEAGWVRYHGQIYQ